MIYNMNEEMLNLRRHFRNRFECYERHGDAYCNPGLDESSRSLLDICNLLQDDLEPFPRHLDRDIRRICGYQASAWFRKSRTYGDAARLIVAHVELSVERRLSRAGLWVRAVLSAE